MKRKVIAFLLVAAMSFTICSCGSNESGNAGTQEEKQEETTQEEKQEETTQEEKQEETTQEEKQEETTQEEQETAVEETFLDIHDGNVFTLSNGTDELEITLKGVDFEQEVHSTSDNMFQQYFADDEAETYIVVKMDIKNIGGNNITENCFEGLNNETREFGKIVVTFDDKYNYNMRQLDVESTVMSKFWNIAPLKSQEIFFLQSVPNEVIDKPFVITFSLVGSDITCRYIRE